MSCKDNLAVCILSPLNYSDFILKYKEVFLKGSFCHSQRERFLLSTCWLSMKTLELFEKGQEKRFYCSMCPINGSKKWNFLNCSLRQTN